MSQSTAKWVIDALANKAQGQNLLNQLGVAYLAATIVAAHASATTDFGALQVGDKVIHIPAVAGSADWAPVVTAGTNPDGAAVVGDLYLVLRANTLATYPGPTPLP